MSEKILYDIADVLPPESSKQTVTEEKFFADAAPVYLDSTSDDDSLTGTTGSDVFVYKGGNDTIINYSGEDTVSIASGKVSTYSFNDDGDLIFKVGTGSITLQYMQGRAITVKDSTGTSTKIYGTGYSGHDTIKNMVKAWNKTFLSGTAKLDESIRLCSHFDTIQEAIDQMVADRKSCSSGDEFLRKYCGIVMDNDDSGGITGWDAGGLSMISADDIVGETLSTLKHLSNYTDFSFTTSQGVNINITNKSSNVNATAKKVLDGLYSWWADESLDLIEKSFGVDFEEGTNISFSVTPSSSYWGVTSGTNVSINTGSTYFNGTNDYNGNGVDMTIAHEFTHVAQNLFMGYFPQFLHEGFADLGVGADNRSNKRSTLISVADNANDLAKYLDVSTNGTGNANYYVAGFMFYRYLARQASINYDSSKTYAWKDGANITGTANADVLSALGTGSTITGGAGNDSLFSYGDKEKVFGGDGKDTLGNSGTGNTLDAGAGDDSINNKGANASIFAGADNDYIVNYADGEGSTLRGGTGNDKIYNYGGSNVLIDGGDGNDLIYNQHNVEYVNSLLQTVHAENVTISGGAGNDSIYNFSLTVSINGGADADTIQNSSLGTGSTIDGGNGDDQISNRASNVIILGGADADTVFNYGASVSVNGGDGVDQIQNYENATNSTLIGGAGDDVFFNDAAQVTIDGGADNDWIKNTGAKVSISGGTGDDTVSVTGANVTVDAGAGNDSISNSGTKVSISGGTGNDTVSVTGANVTVNAGAGNDYISNSGANLYIEYGGGNDYIAGADSTTTLKITDTFTSVASGSNLILTVGSNKISLIGAANKDVTIDDGSVEYKWWLNGTTATYGTATDKLITITGVKSIDDLTISGREVTIPQAAIASSKVTINDGYTLALGDDVTVPEATTTVVAKSNTAATINEATSAGYVLSTDKKTISLQAAKAAAKIATVSGLKSGFKASDITVDADAKTVTLSANALGTSKVSIDKNGTYSLKLASGLSPVTYYPAWKTASTSATLQQTTGAGYTLATDGKSIAYSKEKVTNLTTVSGLKSGFSESDISRSGTTIILSANALGTSNVKATNGYTLALASGVATSGTTTAAWTVKGTKATYDSTTAAYYTANGSTVTYVKPVTKNLTTLSGLKNGVTKNDISLSGTTVTLNANALGTSKVTANNGYTLALASGVATSPASTAAWTIKGTKATYDNTTDAYYTANGSTVTYVKPVTKNLTTLSGLKNGATASDLSLSGTTVTLNANALGTSAVKATNGYTLALGSGVATAGTTTYDWTVSNGKGTYKGTTSDFYTLATDKKSVSYTKEKSGTTLATISGMNTAATKDDIKVSGNTITLTANALIADAKKKITLSNGKGQSYSLALDSSLTTGTQKYMWSAEKTTAIHGWGTTAHYTVSDGKTITYTAATIPSGSQDMWVSNLNAKALTPDANGKIEGISLSGTTLTLSANVLNKKEVKLIGAVAASCKIALGSDVTEKSTVEAATWTHKSTTDTLAEKRTKGYYTDGNYTIKYANKETSTTLATVKGTKRALTLATNYSGDTVTLSDADLATNHKVTISGTKKFSFASDYSKATITGGKDNDTLTVAGANVSLGTAAGDDSISVTGAGASIKAGKGDDYIYLGGGSAVVFFASGEGNDVIANFKATDKLKVTSGTVTAANSGDDVLVTVKKGRVTETITLQGAANQTFSIYDGGNGTREKTLVTHNAVSGDLAASADLLYDTNYDTSAQLGDLVNNAADYSLGDLNVSTDTLTQDKTQLTFGTKK